MGLFESEEDTPSEKEWFSTVTHVVQIEHHPTETRKAVPEKKTDFSRETRSKRTGSKTTVKSNSAKEYDLIETFEEYLLRETREAIENIQHEQQNEGKQVAAEYNVGSYGKFLGRERLREQRRREEIPPKKQSQRKPETGFLRIKQKTISDGEERSKKSLMTQKQQQKTKASLDDIGNYEEFSTGKKQHKPQTQSTFINAVTEQRLRPRRRQVTKSKKQQPEPEPVKSFLDIWEKSISEDQKAVKQKIVKPDVKVTRKRKTKQKNEIKQKQQKLYSPAELQAFSDKWRTWTRNLTKKQRRERELEESLLGKNRKKPKSEIEDDSLEEVFNTPEIQAIRDKYAKNFEDAFSYHHKGTRSESKKRKYTSRRQYRRERRKKENKDKNNRRDKDKDSRKDRSPFQNHLRYKEIAKI